jgi:hypothetical protein
MSHFCAVGGIDIIVGNNNGKGDSFEAIHDFNPESLKKNEVFLCNDTGDFYKYEQGAWQAKGNIGLHWSNSLGANRSYVEEKAFHQKKP